MAGAGGNEDDIIFADLVTGVSNEILQVSTAAEKKFVKLVAVEGYIVFRVTGILMHIQIGAVHFQFLVSDQFPTGSQDAIERGNIRRLHRILMFH